MQPLDLIDRYYSGHDRAKSILLGHSQQVAGLAVRVAGRVETVELGLHGHCENRLQRLSGDNASQVCSASSRRNVDRRSLFF